MRGPCRRLQGTTNQLGRGLVAAGTDTARILFCTRQDSIDVRAKLHGKTVWLEVKWTPGQSLEAAYANATSKLVSR